MLHHFARKKGKNMSSDHRAILLKNANIAHFHPQKSADVTNAQTANAGDASNTAPFATSLLENQAMLIENDQISWIGNAADTPHLTSEVEVIDCDNQWLLPGFIDCHTHLIFGGNRANEFEQRLNGVSYQTIAAQGGGILNTVNATRNATDKQLLLSAKKRAISMLKKGVTSIEIKSGYGLDKLTEQRVLQTARQLAQQLPLTIQNTYLGAHAVPPEYRDNADGYVNQICTEIMPALAQQDLIDAVDIFCESIGFNLSQTRIILERAKQLGLKIKGHTEQLSAMGGSALVAELGGISVDHLEYLQESDVIAMAENGTVATLLPGAFYYLKETKLPPVALLRQHRVPMAVATDFNPGSSPIASIPLMLNMACTLFGLTVEEALLGVTYHAAQALGLQHQIGSLAMQKQADIVCWDISHPRDLVYEYGIHEPSWIMQKGQRISL